jgi:hypothetical protein
MKATRAKYLGFLLCLGGSSAALGEPARICDLAVKHGGADRYAVKVDPARDGSRTIKVDIDGDGSGDEWRWSDSGNSTMTLKLTSNGKSFTLEQQRLQVVKFESHYYVLTTQIETVLGPWYREVFAVSQEGFTRICSYSGKGQVP